MERDLPPPETRGETPPCAWWCGVLSPLSILFQGAQVVAGWPRLRCLGGRKAPLWEGLLVRQKHSSAQGEGLLSWKHRSAGGSTGYLMWAQVSSAGAPGVIWCAQVSWAGHRSGSGVRQGGLGCSQVDWLVPGEVCWMLTRLSVQSQG